MPPTVCTLGAPLARVRLAARSNDAESTFDVRYLVMSQGRSKRDTKRTDLRNAVFESVDETNFACRVDTVNRPRFIPASDKEGRLTLLNSQSNNGPTNLCSRPRFDPTTHPQPRISPTRKTTSVGATTRWRADGRTWGPG
jgi:hypothetical protein